MDSTSSSAQSVVSMIKKDLLSNFNAQLLLSPSPYETAWLAMIPDTTEPDRPMFRKCLSWIVRNQNEEGFWRDYDGHVEPNLETFLATIMCLVALRRWNASQFLINKGLDFIYQSAEQIMKDHTTKGFPRWFSIAFPAAVENARKVGLVVVFPETLDDPIDDLFCNRQEILKREKLVDTNGCSPLLRRLESLPSTYSVDKEMIVRHLKSDGSLFNSPSATASAYMTTGNNKSLSYLRDLVNRSVHGGVSSSGLVDEEHLQLIMVNHLVRLGLGDHFNKEIDDILRPIHRNCVQEKRFLKSMDMVGPQLFMDSLAFWLLRLHGYEVSPSIFCWFLREEDIRDHIEKNYEQYSSVLLNVYRATDLMFPSEHDLEEARSFSKKLLEKIVMEDASQNVEISPSFQRMIKHELALPWTARLDHLEHRMWMEESDASVLWMGKFSFQRFSFEKFLDLSQVAYRNYVDRQSIYRNELEEVKRWSKFNGLCDMGFSREKTAYCYFAVASSTALPYNSYVRTLVAKSATIITVADDFFDEEASLDELEELTEAVRKWDNTGLCGHSKIIFDALDDLVSEVVGKCFQQQGHCIRDKLQHLWHETFEAWLMEAKWGQDGLAPSTNEYLTIAMTSIASHTLVLPASSFLRTTTLPYDRIWTTPYPDITKLLMVTSRLLNDLQSYLKEQKEGNVNFLLLYLKENPKANMEDAISHAQMLLNERKKELLQHILTNEYYNNNDDEMSKSIKLLHLSCWKVFQMFFNSFNRYDSETDVLQDINKAIFVPPEVQRQKIIKRPKLPLPLPPPQHEPGQKKKVLAVHKQYSNHFHKLDFQRPFTIRRSFGQALSIMCEKKMHAPLGMRLCPI